VRLSKEGGWGRLAAALAKRARWSASRPGYFDPFHAEDLRELRKDGARVFPLRPLLAWDEEQTAEPPRVLKNDWRALWMGGLKGKIATTLDAPTQARYPHLSPSEDGVYALAMGTEGEIIGVADLYAHNGVWRDREWQSDGPDADRALLAIVLRFARDGKHAIALKGAPMHLAVERGAFWAWEWAVAPKGGGIWATLAGWVFALRAKALSSRARKQAAAVAAP